MRMPRRRREVHLVTGGGGYPGFSLGKQLALSGHDVILFDIRPPAWPLPDFVTMIQGSITNRDEVDKAFKGVDCVYHMASYGMSGREQGTRLAFILHSVAALSPGDVEDCLNNALQCLANQKRSKQVFVNESLIREEFKDCVECQGVFDHAFKSLRLNKKLIEAVNIGGTDNVIQACMKNNIHRLVYTSTYNVVFGGQEIRNGDESLPYLPLQKHPDHYSKTKSIAEQKVLQANGHNSLRTCALRLAGVYGPEEQRHIPRIVNYMEQGLMVVSYGEGSLQDFLHVDNLVQGHILAAQGLSEERHCIAAGQAYFLSDNLPVNTLEFFQPLIEGLGYKMPKISIPVKLLYIFAFIAEWVHFLVARVYNFQPLLTRTEVYKSCVTHYFSIGKAQRDLGYKPTKVNEISEVLQHYTRQGRVKSQIKRRKQSGFTYFLVNVIIACIFASIILSFLPGVQ